MPPRWPDERNRPLARHSRLLTINAKSSRALAIATLCVYVIFLVTGLAAEALVGHDGVLRPEPHDLPAGASSFTILEIQPGSPADRAGLVAGDEVAAVDGARMGHDDVHQAYHNRRAGQVSVLTVLRAGAEVQVPVVLESRLAIFGVLSGT